MERNILKITIYHNPRCSKSRQTLALLQENSPEENIKQIEYLKSPPSLQELKAILTMLNMSPLELIRKNEEEYKMLNINNSNYSDSELLKLMVENPKLIERPIVVIDDKVAVIGRPPECVLEFFN